jgi:hypothetical protein
MLHDERGHQDDDAADIHGCGNGERGEKEKIKERTWHIASFVRFACALRTRRRLATSVPLACDASPHDLGMFGVFFSPAGHDAAEFSAVLRENTRCDLRSRDSREHLRHDAVTSRFVEPEHIGCR